MVLKYKSLIFNIL